MGNNGSHLGMRQKTRTKLLYGVHVSSFSCLNVCLLPSSALND